MKSWREQTGRKNDRVKENVHRGSCTKRKSIDWSPFLTFPNYNFSNAREKLEIFQIEEQEGKKLLSFRSTDGVLDRTIEASFS